MEHNCVTCIFGDEPIVQGSTCHECLLSSPGESNWEPIKKGAKEMEAKNGINPSVDQSESMTAVFDYLNKNLFDEELLRPMIVFNRNPKVVGGYYAPSKWYSPDDSTGVDEIAINANSMVQGDEIELMQVLVHEMVHQWQQHYGKPGRGGYHNREWADKCLSIGLKPMNVDAPESETGDKINTVLIKGGKAMLVLANMPEEIAIAFYAEIIGNPDPGKDGDDGKERPSDPTPVPKPKSGSRTKYTCNMCGTNLWGKAGVRISCMDCNKVFVETKQ